MTLTYKVQKIIEQEKLIERGERVLIGLSGGIDSTTLLFVLSEVRRELAFDLGIAHINHMLRGEESQRDEEFVKTMAHRFSLPCHITRVDIHEEAKRSGKSIQHAARDVRYGFFTEIVRGHNYQKITVAHTLDDQVETFLLRTLKGTGIRGLSAIPVKRDAIVRPFLHIRRKEIEEYAAAMAVPFVEDSSNNTTVYERNFIRKQIIPQMEILNPAFREKIVRLLKDLSNINQIFDGKSEEFLKQEERREGDGMCISVDALKALDDETRFRVMANILIRVEPGFMPLREHIIQIDKVIAGHRPNLAVTLPFHIRVKKVYDRLIVSKEHTSSPPEGIVPVSQGMNRLDEFGLILHVDFLSAQETIITSDPYTAFFDSDRVGELSVRVFRNGDRFVPLGMEEKVKLKDFFIAQKIPREKRRHIPFLLTGNDIIWIIGQRIDERYKVTGETRHVIRVSIEFPPQQAPYIRKMPDGAVNHVLILIDK
ncbi:MAG: tRNA lysidine(34) synthetase TilS [Syntrophus sp. (in: bacteria)]|nr:tRNA lysidine(34) synthetase TilS [Syntrophus sp. (in: bacteria)]